MPIKLTPSPTARALAVSVMVLVCGTWLSLNQNDYWLRVTTTALNFALVALAWDLLLGYAGQINFAPAAIWGAGGYAAAILVHRCGVDPWLGLPAAAGVGALLGAVLTLPAVRLQRIYLGLFTLAFGELLRLAAINESELTQGPQGIGLSNIRFTGPLATPSQQQILSLFLLIGTYLILRWLVRSRFGLRLQAMRDDQLAAEARGIDTRYHKLLAFTISSAIMGLAGGLFAYQLRYISPDMLHIEYSFQFVVMALFGGVGSLIGPVLGAISITFLLEVLRGWEHLRLILLGVVVVANILFFPHGIANAAIRFLHDRRTDVALRVRFGS